MSRVFGEVRKQVTRWVRGGPFETTTILDEENKTASRTCSTRTSSVSSLVSLLDRWNLALDMFPEGETAAQQAVAAAQTAGKLAVPHDGTSALTARRELDARHQRRHLIDCHRTRDTGTITEVCSGGELPEVEIISLLHEKIPKYRLRADSLTHFGGYDNQDWFIPSPALKVEDADLKLSPDQIRETLNYFLLCSNRVSQMTKTYNDIEAVTRLLEEKEKDLELTARIGKELLAANGRLESNSAALEVELKEARDKITQLLHELTSKTQLLQVLTNDAEGNGYPEDESAEPAAAGAATFELLRRRVGSLEKENRDLRHETLRLCEDADGAEDAERRLFKEFTDQLSTANMDVHVLETELSKQKDECRQHTEQLNYTTQRLQLTEEKLTEITTEHEQSSQLLDITRENQNALASELAEFKERYAELLTHLSAAQEQARLVRRRGAPVARGGALMPYVAAAAGLADSLQCELDASLHSDLSLDSGISEGRGRPEPPDAPPFAGSSYRRTFETVQYASRCAKWGATATAGAGAGSRSGDSVLEGGSEWSSSSEEGPGGAAEEYPGAGPAGVPGVPGAADLAAALRRLTLADVAARRAALADGPLYQRYPLDGGAESPARRRWDVATPDSVMSTGWSSGASARRPAPRAPSAAWRLPDKLQIVKPLEGSHTLHHWAQLATPTMSGLLEERPGVQIRGGRNPGDLGLHVYSLNDVEEDDDYPGKRFPGSSYVYTVTNSTVLHPDDGSRAQSAMSSAAPSGFNSALTSEWGSAASSRVASARHSPTRLSRRNSESRFYAEAGPARFGFSALASPTATPANSPLLSPEGSPPASPPPGPLDPRRCAVRSLVAGGAALLREERGAASLSSLSPLSLRGSSALTGARRSPMAQLTCFKQALYGRGRLAALAETPEAPPAAPAPAAAAPAARRRPLPARLPRADLGTVGARPSASPPASPPTRDGLGYSALGTLSSLLFGRKGGLL